MDVIVEKGLENRTHMVVIPVQGRALAQQPDALALQRWEGMVVENAALRVRVRELEAKQETPCGCSEGCRFRPTDRDSLRCDGCGAECTRMNLAALGLGSIEASAARISHLNGDLARKRDECARLEKCLADSGRVIQKLSEDLRLLRTNYGNLTIDYERLRRETRANR